MKKNEEWLMHLPKEGNPTSVALINLEKAVQKSQVKSCLVLHNGCIALEYYKNKKIKQNIQRLNSCTKSILSILIGIALDKGYLISLEATVGEYFPELLPFDDERKQRITIEQLLNMSSGLDWPEFGEWNFMPPMFTRDVVSFVLNRKLLEEPGTKMNYNSGCSHILSAILTKATGMKTSEFAKKFLFIPLGIYEYRWYEDAKSISYGSDGLHLHPESLAKIGQLYLQQGQWQGTQLVSKDWISRSTKPYFLTYSEIGQYAYHWWVERDSFKNDTDKKSVEYYFAMGRGGTFLVVAPDLNIVVACTGNMKNTMEPLYLIDSFFTTYV